MRKNQYHFDTSHPIQYEHPALASISRHFHERIPTSIFTNTRTNKIQAQRSSKQKFLPRTILPSTYRFLLPSCRFNKSPITSAVRANCERRSRKRKKKKKASVLRINWQLKRIRLFRTLVTAGYYTIEQRSEKYRIIFLNTNLWLNTADNRMLHRSGSSTIDNTQDPFDQWSWFQMTLETARRKKETVRHISSIIKWKPAVSEGLARI